MANISLNQLTVPTPQPYSKNEPTRNQENVCFCCLQLLQLAKDANFTLTDTLTVNVGGLELTGVENAIKDLKFNSITIDMGAWQFLFDGKSPTLITKGD